MAVAVLGTAGPGIEIICGGPGLKICCKPRLFFKYFSLKFLCHKGVFKCFPVISFQFFLRCGAPSRLPKVRGLGPWPPWPPLKPPLVNGQNSSFGKVSCCVPKGQFLVLCYF